MASLLRVNLVPESCEFRGTITARRVKESAMISVDGGSWITGAEVQAVSLGARSTFVDPLASGIGSRPNLYPVTSELISGLCLYRGEMKRGF